MALGTWRAVGERMLLAGIVFVVGLLLSGLLVGRFNYSGGLLMLVGLVWFAIAASRRKAANPKADGGDQSR